MEHEKHIPVATPPEEDGPDRSRRLTPEQEAELIAGLFSRKPAAEVAFLDALQPLFRAVINRKFPSLSSAAMDLIQSGVLKLLELRELPSPEKKIQLPLSRLVWYLVDAPGRVMARDWKRFVELKIDDPKLPPISSTQHALVRSEKAFRARTTVLPRGMAQTIAIHAAHETGGGPPLHEVLGIDEQNAKRRLLRAQQALWKLTEEEQSEEE